jgi:aminopeptidase 2
MSSRSVQKGVGIESKFLLCEPIQAFDSIWYTKGYGVLRMISGILGAEVFTRSIRRYLQMHAYGNVIMDDPLDAPNQDTDKNVAGIAKVWTQSVGYSVMNINEENSRGLDFSRTKVVPPRKIGQPR